MAYIVTGSTGHIGNNIVKALLKEEKQVKLLVRRIDNTIKDLNVEYIVGDIFDIELLNGCINEGDTVIHLAGAIDIKNKEREKTLFVNYEGTKRIIDVCINKKIKKFIYFSTVDAIYKEGDEIISEPLCMYPDKFQDNYSYSKALATEYVMEQRNKYQNIDINILYPSAVIGINDFKPSAIGKVVKDIIDGKMQFAIKGGYNFVDVEDITKATINIINNNISGDFILSGVDVTVKELYMKANTILGKKKKLWNVPLFLVKLCIPFVPYLSKFVLKTILENHNYDNSKMKEVLNINPQDFYTTLDNTIRFFKERGN